MRRWLWRISLGVLLVVVLLLAMMAFVLVTPGGLKLVLSGAQKGLPALVVEDSQGSLLGGFTLDGVAYKDDWVDVRVNSLGLALKSKCLLTPAICIDDIAIDGLRFSMPQLPESEPAVEDSQPVSRVSTPLPVSISSLSLSDIKLDILGNKIGWATFSSGARFVDDVLTLEPTRWDDISVALAAVEEQPEQALTKGPSVSKEPSASKEKEPLVLPEVVIPLEVNIEHFEINNLALAAPVDQTVNQFVFKGSADGHRVTIEQLLLDAAPGKVELDGDIQLHKNYPLAMRASVDIRQQPVENHQLLMTVTGDLGGLRLDADLAGLLQAGLKGNIDVLDPDLPFDLKLVSEHLQWPLDKEPDYLVNTLDVATSGSLAGYRFTLDGDIEGKEIPKTTLSTEGEGDLSKVALSRLDVGTLGGTIHGTLAAGWDKLANWQTALEFDNIQPGLQWPEAEGQLSGNLLHHGSLTEKGGWQVELPLLDINGVVRNEPFSLKGELSAGDNEGQGVLSVVTKGIGLSHGPNAVNAAGKLDQHWDMDLRVDVPDLSASIPDSKGSIKGNVRLSGELETPEIALDLGADNVAWQQQVSLQTLRLKGRVTPLPLVSGNVSLAVDQAKLEGATIDTLRLGIDGTEAGHNLTVKLSGDPAGADLALYGELDREQGWKGTMSRSVLDTPAGRWTMAHPTRLGFDLASNTARVGAHCWQNKGSSLCLDDDIDVGESGTVALSLNDFDFDIVKSLLPEQTQLSGVMDARASAKWSLAGKPAASLDVSVKKGRVVQQLEQPFTVGWNSIDLTASLADNRLDTSLVLDLTDNGTVRTAANISGLDGDAPQIDGTLKVDAVSLAFLTPLLGEESIVAGRTEAAIAFTGPIKKPAVTGSFNLLELEARSPGIPLEIDQGQINLVLAGYSGTLNGNLVTPDGVLALDGSGDWQDFSAWLASLNVKGDKLKVSLPPMLALQVSPDLTISASPADIKVSGNVDIPWGRIEVKQLPASAVGLSDDLVILDKQLQPVESPNSMPVVVNANIDVKIGDDVRLDAFGLKSLLIGNLNVKSDKKGPTINGEINLEKGTYRSFGQDLQISKGQILFNGAASQPYLQIEAIRNPDSIEDSVTAGIRVTGPADEPAVSIFSEPSLPQANALSYLTRGRNLDSDSSGGGMTSMLIGIGLAQSGRLVGEIGQAFGVQDLTVDTAGSGEEEKVEVSGYILPGLQVKYGVGIFDSLGVFTLRYRLMTDLYVEAVSGVSDNAVDLLYQFSIK